MSITFGVDPVFEEVRDALERLDRGERVTERRRLDLKEEACRRAKHGVLHAGSPKDDDTAQKLAGEAVCMANTPGGGALLVGVSNDSTVIGAVSDADWLQRRIYELTDRRLLVDISEAHVAGERVLVVRSPQAVEPVRYRGKITWRVDDRCVEVDAATWHERRAYVTQFDWSAQPSSLGEESVRASAVETARDLLETSGEPGAQDLAALPTADLLRRLSAVTGEGLLTNAGALMFVGRGEPALDYIRRDVVGGDSTARVSRPSRSLVEELSEVFTVFGAHNPVLHRESGLTHGQARTIPTRAAREAVVNAVAHREWHVPYPSTVEHIGSSLVVTSPGGFFGGVTTSNVLTHPSRSRNPALTSLLAALRIAEREGIGVDRMFLDSLRQGNRLPEIVELPTPAVRVTLSGEQRDPAWSDWLARIEPSKAVHDLRWLMVLYRLVTVGWIDVEVLTPFLQTTPELAGDVVAEVWGAVIEGHAVIERVDGVPAGEADAWRLGDRAREALRELDELNAFRRSWPTPPQVALSYARGRGRISSTELGSLLGRAPSNVGAILRGLEDDGYLEPSRPNRRGAGFFYRLNHS